MATKSRLWLIDGSYMYKASYSCMRDAHLDYVKLKDKLEEEGDIWRAYYLNTDVAEMGGFFRWLQSAPPRGPKIIVKTYGLRTSDVGPCYCEACEKNVAPACSACSGKNLTKEQQKGVDVGIATLALTLAEKYETLILSSGDSDLLDMVEYLCHRGKRFELAVFHTGVAPELQARADHIYWIDDFVGDVKRERNGNGNRNG